MDVSLTDFRAEKVGKWNQADPSFVPQYAAFFLLLGESEAARTAPCSTMTC